MSAKIMLMFCTVVALVNAKGCQPSAPELSPVEAQRLDEVLAKWERNTATCDHFRYEFKCWEYDPVFGPKDTFETYREGTIRIAMPNRWYYRVDKTLKYRAPSKAAEAPTYGAADESETEEVSYDGQWLSLADFRLRQVTRLPISPQSGLAVDLELPWYLLGSKLTIGEPLRWLGKIDSQDLKRRYVMRIRSSTNDGDLVIQAMPRRSYESAGVVPTVIILDPALCLPKGGMLFENDWRRDGPRIVYQFIQGDPRVNAGDGFVVPKVEKREGWTVQENPYIASRANNP